MLRRDTDEESIGASGAFFQMTTNHGFSKVLKLISAA
jgi:hypothetical protein